MDIFLDLEKTLLNDELALSKETLIALTEIASKHNVYILTYASLCQTRKIIPNSEITIISVIENRTDPLLHVTPLPATVAKYLIENPYVFSMHSLEDSVCKIYKYQERLKRLYPTGTLKLERAKEAYALLFTCFREGLAEIKENLPEVHIEILAEDKRKLFCKASSFPSSKEAFVQQLKKSPAIGIGDSLGDYAFIQLCETQVAMKNADDELKKLCSYHTEKTNNENGAVEFLINYLKHLQV